MKIKQVTFNELAVAKPWSKNGYFRFSLDFIDTEESVHSARYYNSLNGQSVLYFVNCEQDEQK